MREICRLTVLWVTPVTLAMFATVAYPLVSIMRTMALSTSRGVVVPLLFSARRGTRATNTSPSVKEGLPPPYAQEYLKRFLVPLPNVSASPILAKKSAIIGFFGRGLKRSGVKGPVNLGRFAFSVRIPVSFAKEQIVSKVSFSGRFPQRSSIFGTFPAALLALPTSLTHPQVPLLVKPSLRSRASAKGRAFSCFPGSSTSSLAC